MWENLFTKSFVLSLLFIAILFNISFGENSGNNTTEKAFDCDFENASGSEWQPDSSWKIIQWNQGNSQQLGPPVDHTTSTSAGQYLLLDPTKLQNSVSLIPYSEITSESIPFTDREHCLTFWYYSDSESYFNISIGYTKASNEQNLLFMTPTLVSKAWKPIRVQLPLESNITIQIRILFNTAIVGALAIDDISVTLGQCPVRSGQVCDFSYKDCGLKINRKAPISGTRGGFIVTDMMATNTNLNGPKFDHTTKSKGNYFLFTNRANDPNTDYNTDLIIPGLPSTGFGGNCLKFWYQINTGNTTSFQISVSSINPGQANKEWAEWTVTYPNRTGWTMGQMSFWAYSEHNITFSLAQNMDMTYIALDDISVSEGQCAPAVSCDFEEDDCSWTKVDDLPDSNWNWVRIAAPSTTKNWSGPKLDHTINKPGGTYLYMSTFEDSPGETRVRNAYIESMPVLASTSYCLSFWAHFVGDSSLQVIAVKYGKVDRKARMQTLLTLKNTTTKWTQFSVNIDSNLMSNAVEIALRIKGSFSHPKSVLALDDIALTNNGPCATIKQEHFICSQGKAIAIKQVCNFVNDCPDGEDESNCGNCDFEQGMCVWTTDSAYNGIQWKRESKSSDKSNAIPLMSSDKNNKSGHYMRMEFTTKRYDTSAVGIQSSADYINVLKRSHNTCKLYFDYYMNTDLNSVLYVVVNENNSSQYVWRRAGTKNNNWQSGAVVAIGEHRSPFTVEIIADPRSPQTDLIAIDNILFKDCSPVKPTTGAISTSSTHTPLKTNSSSAENLLTITNLKITTIKASVVKEPTRITSGPIIVHGYFVHMRAQFGINEILVISLASVLMLTTIIGVLLYRRKRMNSEEEMEKPINKTVLKI